MIEAMLHGKLSSKQENMEDVVTSNVFGLLQYVAPQSGVMPFLSRAKSIDGQTPDFGFGTDDVSVSYRFWPRWTHCEPDVVLNIAIAGNVAFVILIEAKHRSGKSSEADDVEGRPNDQLAREWLDLAEEADRVGAQPGLIYLTADICCPRSQIQESLAEYSRKRPADQRTPRIYWLSWRELPGLFGHESSQSPLKAIARMAADKLNFTYFQGINNPSPFRIDWRFHGDCPQWTFHIPTFTSQWTFATTT